MATSSSMINPSGISSSGVEAWGAAVLVVRVLLATPLPFAGGELDYITPQPVALGTVVIVPLGQRKIAGVVTGQAAGDVDEARLKPVLDWPDIPTIDPAQIDWIRKVAAWTLASPGAVLKMMLPSLRFLEPLPVATGLVGAMPPDDTMAKKRRAVLEVSFGADPMTRADIARLAGVSPGLVARMATDGLMREEPLNNKGIPRPDPSHGGLTLNPEQADAADHLGKAVAGRDYTPFLLDGVTGSGKTEVYFEAVAKALEDGRQALVLLPEIALSPATVRRVEERFGVPPLLWHSGLGQKARHENFRAIVEGGPRVVVGARSALFLPFADLGVIIIDEEHDPSYKQDDQVVYHARDMAVMRAAQEKITVVMVSATPSLESEVNAEQGRYQRLGLSQRAGAASLPEIKLVNTSLTPPERGSWIAPPLVTAMEQTLAAGQQVMLFLNRRGYAPVTLCRRCGEKVSCPNCSAWLVTHKSSGRLRCHHCGHGTCFPEQCSTCSAEGEMVPCGPGVERLSEEVSRRFPEASQAVLSSDTVGGAEGLASVMDDIRDGRVDIIIGTQMVAKGHHFPGLTLVGVVDADLGLAGGDLRAAEHTWQLLVQVAGRAGRGQQRGVAVLQTASPETTVLQCLVAGDRAGFIAFEKAARRESGMPPYGRLASILLSSPSLQGVDDAAHLLRRSAPHYEGVTILGPAPAPIAFLRGRHRQCFIIRTAREVNIQAVLREWLGPIRLSASVRMQIDIDPHHFM